MAVAAAANALVTKDEVKYVWGRPTDETTDDDRIQSLINLISGRIAEWCGRVFILTTYTNKVFDHDGGYELMLPEYPVTALTALSIDGTAVDVTAAVASDDLHLYANEGYLRYDPGFPPGHHNVKATFSAGYAAADIPATLKMICIEWVIILLEGRMKDAKVKQEDAVLTPPDRIAVGLAPFKRRDF